MSSERQEAFFKEKVQNACAEQLISSLFKKTYTVILKNHAIDRDKAPEHYKALERQLSPAPERAESPVQFRMGAD